MSTTGWILMVGLRVVDLGALVVWLVWFYRQCDEEDDGSDGRDDFRSHDEPEVPPTPTGGPAIDVPLPDAQPWPSRRRDHGDQPWPPPSPARRAPDRHREPARTLEPV